MDDEQGYPHDFESRHFELKKLPSPDMACPILRSTVATVYSHTHTLYENDNSDNYT